MEKVNLSYCQKNFNEWADFGFTRPDEYKKPIDSDDKLTYSYHIEQIIKELRKAGMGIKEAKQNDFSSEVNWGEGPGALNVIIRPFGGLRASLRRQTYDLNGMATWVTHKVIEIDDKSNYENITEEIIENLRIIDKENIPAPKSSCYNLEKLVIKIAEGINRHSKQKIMMYEAIRILRPQRDYIIHYGVKGMGRQAEGQKRVDQIQIQVKFDEFTGLITVCANEIGDKIGKHSWKFYPSELIEKFTPTQDPKIIIDCMIVSISALYN